MSGIPKQPAAIPPASQPPHLVVADSVRDMGGGERFVLDLARHLPTRGWRVTVLAYPGAPLHHRCSETGLPVHTARTRANGAPWTVLPLIFWLRRTRPDLLLTEFDKDLRTVGLAAHLSGLPIKIINSRECDGPIKDRPWIRAFHNRVADRILVASEATRQSSIRSAPWLDPARVQVIGKGIPLAPLLDVAPLQNGPLRLGYLGQLVERKRVHLLIAAMTDLDIKVTLRVAGRGPQEAALRGQARRCGIEDRVHFDGFVTDLPAWFETIDALVLPSLEEGWGYVLAEAAAAGRMILAFDSSSVGEVTPAEQGALLVDARSGDTLAAGLRTMVAMDFSERSERARRLREHARSSLGLDRMLDELDTFFRATLAPPR